MDSTIVAALIGLLGTIAAPILTIFLARHFQARGRADEGSVIPTTPSSDTNMPGPPLHPGPPPRFTVAGEVIPTIGQDLGIRAENEAELRAFWTEHRLPGNLGWFGPGAPVVSIGRKADRARCRPGDRARLTFVVKERADGTRGTRTVDFDVLS
jgi:hypothetical protein